MRLDGPSQVLGKMWSRRAVNKLARRGSEAGNEIKARLQEERHALDDQHVVWGQFLNSDRDHTQYGVYGTSAAVACLLESGVPEANSNIVHALASLPFFVAPESAVTGHDANDTASNFKLASVVDAIADPPEESGEMGRAAEALLDRVVDGSGWGNFFLDHSSYDPTPRVEPTLTALHALRLNRSFRNERVETCRSVLSWISREMSNRAESTPATDALALLVFDEYSSGSRSIGNFRAAQLACLSRLRRWYRLTNHDLAVHSEYHYEVRMDGMGESKYVFFPTYLMVPLALLRSALSSGTDRRWACKIVKEVTQRTLRDRGYRVDQKICTVDQLWASRLLRTFASTAGSNPHVLISPPFGLLSTGMRQGITTAIVLVLSALGIYASLSGLPILVRVLGGVFAAFALALLGAMAAVWWSDGKASS